MATTYDSTPVRINGDLYEQVKRHAEEDSRSITVMVNILLEEALMIREDGTKNE